ncbi:MAG: 2-isopropylmalate synthase, partial [Planctomycetaceae bacterium]|nr:2-isopropylmalate synthase [Planctomycetaceae bacterium]
MSDRKIVIFDTTLRDGEQSPGASMNMQEKLEVAQMLTALGVDVIEAGFPVASPGDFESVQKIAQVVKGSSVCGLARCKDIDIETAWEAVKAAERPRIHVFIATSPIHREFKLHMTKEQVLQNTDHFVRKAAALCPDIEFSAEDASRTELDFLCEVVEVAIRAGAKTVNIPDTVGYALPSQFAHYIRTLKTKVPNIDQAVIS